MRKIIGLVSILAITTTAEAQTSVDSVKATIDRLFIAMKTSDAELLKSCFADSAILQTIAIDKEGKTIVKTDAVAAFAAHLATVPKGVADERITYDMVSTDAHLAIAWTPYQFYRDGKFSHCGVNSFQLVRFNGNWKIQYLIDTRRKQPCQ